MFIETGETHRQFYERLLQHVKQHMARPGDTADGVSAGSTGDTISVTPMNLVAVQWLRKINPALLDIVRTEYATELRENKPLASLVPKDCNQH